MSHDHGVRPHEAVVVLQNLILKLKKWIKILEAKTKVLPKSFLVKIFFNSILFLSQEIKNLLLH